MTTFYGNIFSGLAYVYNMWVLVQEAVICALILNLSRQRVKPRVDHGEEWTPWTPRTTELITNSSSRCSINTMFILVILTKTIVILYLI